MKTTISNQLSWGAQTLKTNHIPNPTHEASLLLQFAMRLDQSPLLLNPDTILTSQTAKRFKKFIQLRSTHLPFAYITGEVNFFNQKIFVNRHTLIPRPETEILVELIINYLKNINLSSLSIVDIGTGSGAISIALTKTLPNIKITATDKSALALRQAAKNVTYHKLNQQINLLQADLLQPFPDQSLDLIIANLPYVPEKEIDSIDKTVKDYEPYDALFSGPDGLDCIKKLLRQAKDKLKPTGAIFLEIWPSQTEAIKNLAEQLFTNCQVIFHPDLIGTIRFMQINLH